MKATGEVMSIGSGFEIAFMKAVRSIELGIDTPNLPKLEACGDEEIKKSSAAWTMSVSSYLRRAQTRDPDGG